MVGVAGVLAACGGGGGREIAIVATDDVCAPTTVRATAGERVTFVVRNNAGGDREFEGEDGTRLEEVLIPAGRTRRINYTVPNGTATQTFKCYIPGGPETLVELVPTDR